MKPGTKQHSVCPGTWPTSYMITAHGIKSIYDAARWEPVVTGWDEVSLCPQRWGSKSLEVNNWTFVGRLNNQWTLFHLNLPKAEKRHALSVGDGRESEPGIEHTPTSRREPTWLTQNSSGRRRKLMMFHSCRKLPSVRICPIYHIDILVRVSILAEDFIIWIWIQFVICFTIQMARIPRNTIKILFLQSHVTVNC